MNRKLMRASALLALCLGSCAGSVRCDPTPSYSELPAEPDASLPGWVSRLDGGSTRLDGSVPPDAARWRVPGPCELEPCAAEAVFAGPFNTCVTVRGVESGEVSLWCWGRSDGGQFGTFFGDLAPPTLQLIFPGRGVAAVALGRWHMCVLTGTNLYCTGTNVRGVLGPSPGTRFAQLVLPVDPTGVDVRLVAGLAHTCVGAPGALLCIGDNSVGQLHELTTPSSFSVVPLEVELGLPTVGPGLVSGSWRATCAGVGDVTCWGQLEGRDPIEPGEILIERSFYQLPTLGPGHVCVLRPFEGLPRVECLGRNAHGELGRGSLGGWWSEPAPVLGLGSASQVAAGGLVDATLHTPAWVETGEVLAAHTCAIDAFGAACWGSGEAGQLGQGVFESASSAVRVALPASPVRLALGGIHSCALLEDGRVACWGDNTYGQLGGDSEAMPRSAVPVIIPWIAGR